MLRILALCAALAGPAAAQSDAPDLLDTARADGRFAAFLAAAEAAGLTDALDGDGPFTLFVPTDAAFAALPESQLEDLLAEHNRDRLTATLSYHVVPGDVRFADLVDGEHLDTVNGTPLNVRIDEGRAVIGNATVAEGDIVAANGILHAVDAVLVPPEE